MRDVCRSKTIIRSLSLEESISWCRAYLIKLHHLNRIHRLGLVQRHELYFFGGQCLVRERSLYCVQIMCAYCNKRPLSSKVLMQLILQSNKRLISCLCKLDVAQDRPGNERSYP